MPSIDPPAVEMHPAIAETLPFHTDEDPTGTQPAFHAVIHVVVPGVDEHGQPMDEARASDWIAELLRFRVLDWGYVRSFDLETLEPGDPQTPIPITVCKPYIEGTFLSDDD